MPLKSVPKLFLVLLLSIKSYSQSTNLKKEIDKNLNEYFALERESIHLHLNKQTYLSEENIWFKGYVFNKKMLKPFFNTTNVYVVLYNQEGVLIDKKLTYCNLGTFQGNFKNLNKLPSGNYFIQVYTNWMNNFQENESSLYSIKILNPLYPNYFDTTITNLNAAQIKIYPEGGTLIYGIMNTVGVKITDNFNNPIGDITADLKNSVNEVVAKVAINSEGMGKFIITPKNNTYSLSINLNNQIIEKPLPFASIEGFSLEVNSYALPEKASIKIKTNAETFRNYKSKKLFLLVHQNERFLIFDVSLNPETFEQNIIFSTENISVGVNTIRLIDENKNQLAERLFIKQPLDTVFLTYEKTVTKNGNLQLDYNSNQIDSNLSMSVLPINSNADEANTTINADFYCNSYLLETLKNPNLYATSISKKYELDLLFLNQEKSKYSWNDIINNPPIAKNDFDLGLTIKGKLISPNLKKTNEYNIRFRSFHHLILTQSPISKTGEFEFANLILNDSTTVDFSLYKNADPFPLKLVHNARIINGDRTYKFQFKGLFPNTLNQQSNSLFEELPTFYGKRIKLSNVDVSADKSELKRANYLENSNLRGFKVPESMSMSVLVYLESSGFKVTNQGSEVTINSRNRNSINGPPPTPVVFLDNFQIRDFSQLQTLTMDELDEIYINTRAIVPSIQNFEGIVRMYRRIPKVSVTKSNLQYTELINGFEQPMTFENVFYNVENSPNFSKFGVLNWIPTVLTGQKNIFQIDVPGYKQNSFKVIIEGFTFDGKFISQTQKINL